MYPDENPRTNIMKRTILFITSLVLMTSVSFSQSKVNINNLVQYGEKWFKQNDDEPYTGIVFRLSEKTGNKILNYGMVNGLMNGRYETFYENGQIEKEGTWKDEKQDGVWTEWYDNGRKKNKGIMDYGNLVKVIGQWNRDGSLKE